MKNALLFLIGWLAGTWALGQSTPPPNVVIFIADDVSWNDLGCYGNGAVKTPHIDRLAAEGVRFTNVFLTASSCSPSRASILSGRYPHNTGAAELHTPLPAEVATFPRYLRQAGYHCVSSGKWHLGPNAEPDFDLVQQKNIGDGGEALWLDALQNRPRDKPFFTWLAALDAHREWGENEYSGTNPASGVVPPPYLLNKPATREDLARYYDEISRFDAYVGKVVEELEKQGVLDNTLLLVMADNGRPFPRTKTRLYDEGIKTPFVLRWPAGTSAKNVVSESLISVIDLAPTILELAGVTPAAHFQGRSFTKVLQQPQSTFRQYVFAEHNWHDYEAYERMVRTKDWLYITNARPQFPLSSAADVHHSASFQELVRAYEEGTLEVLQKEQFMSPRPVEELYDCRADPLQLTNLIKDPKYTQELQKLRLVLKQWSNDTDDTLPQNLTPSRFDWFTGEKLNVPTQYGEMPGTTRRATRNTDKGPF
ncbi:sulfatase [Rhabdobacter roseus]|uniref:Arylsulfatase A-like enzyme n=1 Tax=Rhabdobacter roseus TaxID=1655419 RepID=A0A840TP44_9BACT|nr:sulfatase [Rhabdobacter roseus]MBB5285511.1 arylsulfatase A-like enzyme [Rhabdobacter roseus]